MKGPTKYYNGPIIFHSIKSLTKKIHFSILDNGKIHINVECFTGFVKFFNLCELYFLILSLKKIIMFFLFFFVFTS